MSDTVIESGNETALVNEASTIRAWAQALVVASKQDADEAADRVRTLKGIRQRWVEFWAEPKKAAAAAHKSICGKEKTGLDVIDSATSIAGQKLTIWIQAERQKAEAAQRLAQAEADRRARLERERLEAQAAKARTPEKAAALAEQAAQVQAVQVDVPAATVDSALAGTRKTWKAELVDIQQVIAAATPGTLAAGFLMFNEKVANAFARDTKGSVKVPGVRFFEVETMAFKTSKE